MEPSDRDVRLQRKSIFEFWRSIPPKGRLNEVINFVKSSFDDLVVTESQDEQLKAFLKKECEKIRVKWNRKQRRLDLFLKVYDQWLCEDLTSAMFVVAGNSPKPSTSGGRPQKSFVESSKKTKKRKVQHLLNDYSKDQLTFAAQLSVRASGKRDAATLIEELSTASPKRATTYKKVRRINNTRNKQRPFTPEEALAFFISNNFTVQTYKNVQQEAKERRFNVYPCYDHVAQAKKQCYPPVENITVTNISAEVRLDSLLEHTALRICKNILGERFDTSVLNYTLIYKWGCDGSSGHSLYKQPFEDIDSTDEYMFIISLVPLRLVNNVQKIIWENPRPSSPRFCRIIKFLYKKECEALIKEECKSIENQIRVLMPTLVEVKGVTISITHQMILSMIDGKVCNVLAENKSTERCFICKATSKEMNSALMVREPDENMYRFGISSLYAYIRTMECLLNISYRMNICEWQIRGDKNKEVFKKTKDEIKKKFKEIGLIIDKVKPGFGTSNDGIPQELFFYNYVTTAQITGLNESLILHFGTILAAIASGFEIDMDKFQNYCEETRKISRYRSNYDLMKYLLTSSYPYITLLRKLSQKQISRRDIDIRILLKD